MPDQPADYYIMESKKTLRTQLEQIKKEFRKSGWLDAMEVEIGHIHDASQKVQWSEGMARSLYYQSRAHEFRREIPKAQELNSKAAEIARKLGLLDLELDCMSAEANLHLWDQKLKEAYSLALETTARAEKVNASYNVCYCNYVLGSVSQRYSSDDDALRYFHHSLTQAQQNGYHSIEGKILFKLSELFLTRQKLTQAEKYAHQYLTVQKKSNRLASILKAQIRLVTILVEAKKNKEAEEYIRNISEHENLLHEDEKGSLALCKGKLFMHQMRYSEAEEAITSAIGVFESSQGAPLLLNAWGIACEMYIERGDVERAVTAAKQALKLLRRGRYDYLEEHTYRMMYETSKLANDAPNALKYLELYNEHFVKQREQLLETRIQFIELQEECEMKKMEITQERQRSDELRIELEYKERELTEKTRHLIMQTESLTQFRDDLRAIIRRSPANDPLIRDIKERLKSATEVKTKWEEFEEQFQAVHPFFQSRLKEKFPTLTGTENKVCTMLRLGLTTTDIAKLLYVTDRNIENHRYRIRKKLLLNSERSLHEYLASI
ncbi:MAG: LuxR C-terminal-related transcriptional regulator [Bacteroidota bacterium]|nr:LuxR C-terminal-related transcriptional regulator [Bacteroidota bacterium]MDP4230090.1 LuxR C-terminal-related transcriptional regulator [Bacteroidota bacterium]MDP4236163.1 LuxR C-terminal-related transcriptional regulator [Bacteroidota bacterium]